MFEQYKFQDKTVYVVGDLHGNFNLITYYIKQLKISDAVIIFAGDIGLGFEKEQHYKDLFKKVNKVLKERNVTCLFVHGNHDCPSYFSEKKINLSNVKSIPDYSVVSIYQDWDYEMIEPPKFNILCVGGATSIDREYRKAEERRDKVRYFMHHPLITDEEYDKIARKYYWPDEQPVYNEKLLEEITNAGINIEAVVTHTAPSFAYPFTKEGIKGWLENDPTLENDIDYERKVMDWIYDYLKKNKHTLLEWYYGHFHSSRTERVDNVTFKLLNNVEHKWDMAEILKIYRNGNSAENN
jgi:predicted phosphodiesterase